MLLLVVAIVLGRYLQRRWGIHILVAMVIPINNINELPYLVLLKPEADTKADVFLLSPKLDQRINRTVTPTSQWI